MSSIELAEITSGYLLAPVQYAILSPADASELPMCVLLLGGGGTRDALFDLQRTIEGMVVERRCPADEDCHSHPRVRLLHGGTGAGRFAGTRSS